MASSFTLFYVLAAVSMVTSQSSGGMGGMGGGMGGMGSMGGMGGSTTNFNLNTLPGILGFLNMEGIDPTSVVIKNCAAVGHSCTPGGQVCCFSPVFSCQGSPGQCRVVPEHVAHIPQIRQIAQAVGLPTQSPIQ